MSFLKSQLTILVTLPLDLTITVMNTSVHTISLFVVALICIVSTGFGILNHMNMLSVGKRSGRRTRESTVYRYLDEFEELPAVKAAIDLVMGARQIAVLRMSNGTLVAYNTPRVGKHTLQHAIDCAPLHRVVDPRYHLLVTGVVGDCRKVVKHVKQLVLNHSMEFLTPPTAEMIAHSLRDHLKSSQGRQLACHAFIIDSGYISSSDTTAATRGKVLEVNTAGSYSQIVCGTAGFNMIPGGTIMQREYCDGLSLNDCKMLMSRVFNASEETNTSADCSYRFFVLPDVEIR